MTLTSSPAVAAATWKADPSHSAIGFDVRYMLITTLHGRFGDVEASLDTSTPEWRISGCTNMLAVTTFDEQRDAHLHTPEFFDTERYPEATFDGRFTAPDRVEGELTIKGTTRPVTFEATVSDPTDDPWGNTRIAVEMTATIDRREFGVSWNAPLPGGGVLVDDSVKLVASWSFIRQEPTDG